MANQQPQTASEGGAHDNSGRATAIGVIAIGLWSALALLVTLGGALPPFELLSFSFAIAFLASVLILGLRGKGAFRMWRQPLGVWAFGFGGIFIYHALYFYALNQVPAVEASLINYLWPLLIVLFSTLADRSSFRPRHLVGAVLGFCGSALAILGPSGTFGSGANMTGYGAALACAIVWAGYSVLNRRFEHIPSELIGGICGLVAVAGFVVHVLFEPTVWPTAGQWTIITLLGIGPVGAAFFAWDYATKHGRLPLLGALSYLAPLFSTLLLLATGATPVSWTIIAATLLIVAGAITASFRPAPSFQASRKG